MNSLLDNFWHYVMPEIILSNFIIYLVKYKKLKFPFCFHAHRHSFIHTQKKSDSVCLHIHLFSILFYLAMAWHFTLRDPLCTLHRVDVTFEWFISMFASISCVMLLCSWFLILSYSLTCLLAFKTQQIMKIGEYKKENNLTWKIVFNGIFALLFLRRFIE